MAQVYGAGGKTTPKAGRNGTGSYHPAGTPLFLTKGNVFPGINPVQPDFHQTTFGDMSRASVATVVGQNRVNSTGTHPNKAQYNTITLPLAPAETVSGIEDRNNLQPIPPFGHNALVMPHERNTNSASGTKKKPVPFRTAFGASKSMPTDSAFQHDPNANYGHQIRQRPNSAVEAVKKVATTRTFVHVDNPLPVNGGVNPKQQHRTPPASFVTKGNLWSDPNNSFIAGQTTVAGNGAGRWEVVKTGVVPGNVTKQRGAKPNVRV